jgi:nucleotide-binding universal stress UspA family protein
MAVGGEPRGGRFHGLILDSTARALVNYAPCPVLVVRDGLPDGA